MTQLVATIKRPSLHSETLEYLYDHFRRSDLIEPDDLRSNADYAECRFVLVCEDNEIGGLFSSIDAACESYDWDRGFPNFAIDLCSAPSQAVVAVCVEVSTYARRESLHDYVDREWWPCSA